MPEEEFKGNILSHSYAMNDDKKMLLVSEDVHYFTQVADNVWEDHKAPNTKAAHLTYERMAYMTRKMVKQSKKPNEQSDDPLVFIPD